MEFPLFKYLRKKTVIFPQSVICTMQNTNNVSSKATNTPGHYCQNSLRSSLTPMSATYQSTITKVDVVLQKKIKELQAVNNQLEESNERQRVEMEKSNNELSAERDKVLRLQNDLQLGKVAVQKEVEELKKKIEELQAAYDELEENKEQQRVELEKANIELKAEQAKVLEVESLLNSEKVMAKHEFTFEKLADKIEKLLRVIQCTICKEVVRSGVVQCENEHLLCAACLNNDIDLCPTCQHKFSETPSHVVSQILEILPTRCKYRNCPKILNEEEDEDHETYCNFRPTVCKLCPWIGLGKDVANHMDAHPQNQIQNGMYVLHQFDPNEGFSRVTLCLTTPVMWCEVHNNPEHEVLSFIMVPIPNGKPISQVFVIFSFKYLNLKMEYELQINLNPDVDIKKENVFVLPHKMLQNFIDGEGNLNCQIHGVQKNNP